MLRRAALTALLTAAGMTPVHASELPLSVPCPFGPLPGTLTLPAGKGPFPVALLIAGSGPQDADETIGPNKPFRDVAQGLAAAGVASFRYDKRTFAYRTESALDKHLTVDDEVVDDALTALAVVRDQPGIDSKRVFVVGHSLGAMEAPQIAKRDGHVAGVVLMAAPARSLLDVSAQQVREQGQKRGLTAEQIATHVAAIDNERALLAGAKPDAIPDGNFGGAPQSYWMSLQGNDQVAIAVQLRAPLLILQGAADFQVSPTADFAMWQKTLAARHDVTFHLYPDLSHLFMPAGSTGTVKDYAVPAHVAPDVIRDMAMWISKEGITS